MATSHDVPTKDTSFLIVGAGTIGLSTAFHLTERGYTNITVIDREAVPSPFSAGTDLNKIVRADYDDDFYAGLALHAIRTWRHHPLFTRNYKPTGYLIAASPAAPTQTVSLMPSLVKTIQAHPDCPPNSIHLTPTPGEIKRRVPQITGLIQGWSGYFNENAGYARAADALRDVYRELVRRGVRFAFGRDGEAVEVIPWQRWARGSRFTAHAPRVRTASGLVYTADKVILSPGAHTARILPEAGKQLVAKSWAVGHIVVSQEEAARLMGCPVVNCRDLGFFFEPAWDESRGQWLIKCCAHGGGYSNFEQRGEHEKVSLPPNDARMNEGIPAEEERKLRALLQATLPRFAQRPLVKRFICWCADTVDSEYIIDYVPGWDNLVLAGGDSGHAFKMFPVFGEWVVDMLEAGGQARKRWRWKDTVASGQEDIHWRSGTTKDIKDFERIVDGRDRMIAPVTAKL